MWTCGWRREGSSKHEGKEDTFGARELGREEQAEEWGLVKAAPSPSLRPLSA